MASQEALDGAYMAMARVWAGLSRARRLQVGCLIVKDSTIIADGFNGTPSGFENACEGPDGKTLPEVIHAEANAIAKLARAPGASSAGATLYSTARPCLECSKQIVQAGITRVVYGEHYGADKGERLLRAAGVDVSFKPEV